MTEWKVGRFVLLDRIAAGGMGEVYLALEPQPNGPPIPRAVKLMLPHLAQDPAAVTAFIQEARIAARATHPALVQVIDLGKDGATLYLAMELVRGVSLQRLVRAMNERELPVDEGLVLYVGHQLLAGLEHLHSVTDDAGHLGVVHRDVTPANVLVDANGAVKLADFGIAKARDSLRLTRPGAFKGRLDYVAPETLRGSEADERADVWGAALVLWTMACGRSPFDRPSEAATVMAIDSEPLPALPAGAFSAELAEAIARGTEKRRGVRVASAAGLAELLPPAPADAAERLGALVRELFAAHLQQLEQTEAKVEGPPTADAAVVHEWTEAPTVPAPGRVKRRRRWPLAVASVALVAVAAAAAWWAQPAEVSPWDPVVEEAFDAGAQRIEAAAVGAEEADAGPTSAAESSPTRPPRATPPVLGGSGWLNVDAVPWAQVSLDGKALGETPLRLKVPAGHHRLELFNPSSGKRRARRVTISPELETKVKEDL